MTVATELESRGKVFHEHGARAARVGLMTTQASQSLALRWITRVWNAGDRVTVNRVPSAIGEIECGDMLISKIILGQANLATEDRCEVRVLHFSVD